MCKRTTVERRQETGDQTAYEGQTTRLTTRDQRDGGARGRWPHAWCWHLLWLLWPLGSLLNWSGQQALRLIEAAPASAASGASSVVALVLIAVGVALIRRSR